MHPILLKVQKYLTDVAEGKAEPISKELFVEYTKANIVTLNRTFSKRPDEFRLRMSNVGRPTCQLQLEAAGVPAEESPYYAKFRDTFGDITESLAVLVLRAAGVGVVELQTHVSLDIVGERINGTLDIVIDEGEGPQVWDIKSCSGWMFTNKFKDFKTIAEDDPFGYVAQGYGYAKARDIPFGGWIVINKEDGQWNVLSAPFFDDNYREVALKKIEENVLTIVQNRPFKRSFSDKAETFRKKETGNRVLGITCSYCPRKHACWNDLQYLPSVASTSDNPKKVWYTHLDEKYGNSKIKMDHS